MPLRMFDAATLPSKTTIGVSGIPGGLRRGRRGQKTPGPGARRIATLTMATPLSATISPMFRGHPREAMLVLHQVRAVDDDPG